MTENKSHTSESKETTTAAESAAKEESSSMTSTETEESSSDIENKTSNNGIIEEIIPGYDTLTTKQQNMPTDSSEDKETTETDSIETTSWG